MQRLLIANRGEIALRINRSAKKLGIETVLPYVASESGSPYLENFSIVELIPVGGFLDPELLVSIAKKHGCDAIHPGYGFLSESAEFSELVTRSNLTFIGPSAQTMKVLGDKSSARLLARKLGIPISEGYEGDEPENQIDEALVIAGNKIGFPLLIKSAAGGGGRGMRRVSNSLELMDAIQSAKREALTGFGNSKLLLERFFENARHIEVQVIGDSFGDIRQLGERDCSIQRRYQKLIEEAPAAELSDSVRKKLFGFAVEIAKAGGLLGVSTVEFLVNSEQIIFLEVNTRLQVEHTVTEEMLRIDLVELQLLIAQGKKLTDCLPKKMQNRVAIEVRIVAEDNDFIPSTGVIRKLSIPDNVRVEHSLYQGMRVTGEFDSLLAKLIVVGDSRVEAVKKLCAALDAIEIVGVPSNLEFLKEVVRHKDYQEQKLSADFVQKVVDILNARINLKDYAEAAVQALESSNSQETLRLLGVKNPSKSYLATCEGKEFTVESTVNSQSKLKTEVISPNEVIVSDKLVFVRLVHPTSKSQAILLPGDKLLRANLSGKVVSVKCQLGDKVVSGQVLVVIESMKMEHSLKSKVDGVVGKIHVTQGQSVQAKAALVELDA